MRHLDDRAGDLADAVTEEMGAPPSLAAGPQVQLGIAHLVAAIDVLKNFSFEEQKGESLIAKEPIGVCGLITPWNWPINQIAVKVYPALATGCTVVLKPSEVAPFSAYIFAEILDAAAGDLQKHRIAVEAMDTHGIGPVTISAGIAKFENDYDFGVTLKAADRRLYQAKAGGRNCVV